MLGLEKNKKFYNLTKSYGNSKRIRKDFNLICFGGGKFSSYERSFLTDLKIENDVIQIDGGDEVLNYLYTNCRIFVSINLRRFWNTNIRSDEL